MVIGELQRDQPDERFAGRFLECDSAPPGESVLRRNRQARVLTARWEKTQTAKHAGLRRMKDEGEMQSAFEQSIHVLLNFAIVQLHPHVRHPVLIRPQDAVKERIYRIRTIANMQLDALVLSSARTFLSASSVRARIARASLRNRRRFGHLTDLPTRFSKGNPISSSRSRI